MQVKCQIRLGLGLISWNKAFAVKKCESLEKCNSYHFDVHLSVKQHLSVEHGCKSTLRKSKLLHCIVSVWCVVCASVKLQDTDGLHSLQRLLEGDGAHAPALPVLVLLHVGPLHHPRHGEHLLQLLPAHLEVQL